MPTQDVIDFEAVHYLSGPMSGLPEFNYPYFRKVAIRLRALGLEVRSPHEIETPPTELQGDDLWDWCMEKCLRLMEGCDAIILLPGWPLSRDAKRELKIALQNNFIVYYYAEPPGKLINMSRLPR